MLFEQEVVKSIAALEKAVETMSRELEEFDKLRTKITAYVSVLVVIVPIVWHLPWGAVFKRMLNP